MGISEIKKVLAISNQFDGKTQQTDVNEISFLKYIYSAKNEFAETDEMELFKKEFYEDLSKITNHPTVSNSAVNISEEAFKAMKDDPQYRAKILSLIQRDLGDSYAPRSCSVMITVGAALNEYRADSWSVGYDSEFNLRSEKSFYKRSDKLEEYLDELAQINRQRQKKLLNEKITELESERSALLSKWIEKKQSEKIAAYENSIMAAAAKTGKFLSL